MIGCLITSDEILYIDVHQFNVFGHISFVTAAGNTKGESITVPLTSCLTGLD